ncbi:MAG: hypothetical protein ACOYLP_11120 [Flavobacterium sp.]|uniref:hypothetical protein n=1 Tax=Flavobacterium sp. TaxID=239 RepID=UPI003BDE4DFE
MTQLYASITITLFSFYSISCVTNVSSHCVKKIKSSRISLLEVFMQMYGKNSSKKAMFNIVSNSDFKSQVSFINRYLAYASSHGIGGGGGGGGHGGSYFGNIRDHDTFQVFSFPIKLKFYNSI